MDNIPVYILTIIDGGIIQRTIADVNFIKLIEDGNKLIAEYLLQHGTSIGEDNELTTEDGCAKIVKVAISNPVSDEDIWSYAFDGEISLSSAINYLLGQYEFLFTDQADDANGKG
ncbi:MAG: hypothetical protein ACE3L7_01795 [Candidatus Pristimantibacillus sp.]